VDRVPYRAHVVITHGNERTFLDIEVPVMADGTILGVKARAVDDVGAYLHYEPLGAVSGPRCLRLLQVQECQGRFHLSTDEQVSGSAKSWLLAHAATVDAREGH